MWQTLCRYLTYPLWDLKDGRGRLREYRSLLKSQRWDLESIQRLQLERLRTAVSYAYENCDYYRQRWGTAPQLNTLEDIRKLPLVTKTDIRAHPEGFISKQWQPGTLIEAKTGGSTGVALRLFFDEACQKTRNAAALRSDGWSGWKPGMLVASLWGSPYLPKTLKEKIRNTVHDRLFYLDTMKLNDATMSDFGRQMQRRNPEALFGHAHSLFVFARFLKEAGIVVPPVQSIVATSMMLLENERKVIEEVFRCSVTNRYGCEEVGLIASECEVHRGLHVNAEHVIVELLREDGSYASPGEEGKIVVTDLMNRGMPLIRYVIEDLGVPGSRVCSCGRALPLIERVTGRMADFLKRRDGSLVAGVSLVEKTLTAIDGIEQLQIIQNTLTDFVLNVVPAKQRPHDFNQELGDVIREVFGADINIDIRRVERLAQERNAKYRFSICRIGQTAL